MLVGLGDALLAQCTAALKPLRIETVPDEKAACDRALLSRPFVIVVPHPADEELTALARDISAQIVDLAKTGAQRLELNLKAAYRAAQVIRLRAAHDEARDDAPELVEEDIVFEDE
jgi:ABC-type arginine transport system ATPase subunit